MKHIILITILLNLISCASNPGNYKSEEEAENKLLSLTEEQVAMNLGAPTEKVTLSSGAQTWTYRDDVSGITGGECTVSVIIKEGKVIQASVTADDRSWVSYPLGSCKNIFGNFK